MTLREQFEKHRNVMRPCEPYIESENPEQWVRVLEWQEEYSDWLETKLQSAPSNSDYAKSCDDCIYGVDGCQHEPPCTTGTGKPYYKKRDFA